MAEQKQRCEFSRIRTKDFGEFQGVCSWLAERVTECESQSGSVCGDGVLTDTRIDRIFKSGESYVLDVRQKVRRDMIDIPDAPEGLETRTIALVDTQRCVIGTTYDRASVPAVHIWELLCRESGYGAGHAAAFPVILPTEVVEDAVLQGLGRIAARWPAERPTVHLAEINAGINPGTLVDINREKGTDICVETTVISPKIFSWRQRLRLWLVRLCDSLLGVSPREAQAERTPASFREVQEKMMEETHIHILPVENHQIQAVAAAMQRRIESIDA